MARFVPPKKLPVHDGTGTMTPRFMTGHGAPAPAQMGVMRGSLLPNNWGARSLRKLSGATPGANYGWHGQIRFMQPTLSETAQVTPPGVGAPPDRTGIK